MRWMAKLIALYAAGCILILLGFNLLLDFEIKRIENPPPEKITQTVCLFLDGVSEETAKETIVYANSQMNLANINLQFRVVHYHIFVGNVPTDDESRDCMLRHVCPEANIVILFTNKENVDEKGDSFVGGSSALFGTIVLYEAEHRKNDLCGNKGLNTTFLHEIGHLYDAEHEDDKSSFMYAPSEKSCGKLSEGAARSIRININRTWPYPPREQPVQP